MAKNLINCFSVGSELAALVDNEQRRSLLKGLFENYYASLPASISEVFDTSRSWTAHLGLLNSLFPNVKVVCCVRNVAWIMDSLERQYQKNALENTGLFQSDAERSSLFTRLETLAKPTRMVGFPLAALQEAMYGPHASNLLIVEYDKLVSNPEAVLTQLYKFFELPHFLHDFECVEFEAATFDSQLGIKGLHTVHRKIEPRPRASILPPDLFLKYSGFSFWEAFRKNQSSKSTSICPVHNGVLAS